MKLRKLLTVVMTLVGALVAGMVAPSPAFAYDNGPWEIFDYSADWMCMEVAGASTQNSAQVQIWDCGSFYNVTPLHQRWIFRNTTNGYYRLVNGNSGKCANIKGSTDANSTKIIQYICGTSDLTLNDQWYPDPSFSTGGHDWYRLRSRLNYGKCLNVQGNGTSAGTDLILYTCGSGANNFFSWRPATQV
jgi:hypothetical protein